MDNKTETKLCKKCKEEINKKAKRCPKCGANLGMPGIVKFLIIFVIIIACIVGCMGACTKGVVDSIDEAVKETENEYKDVNGKTEFKKGESFENKHVKITMSDVNSNFTNYSKYATLKSGYVVLMAKFDVSNIGDSDQYISLIDFNCYADDASMERFYSYDDKKYPDLSATLSKGKKTSGYIFFEVPKNAKKIVLEYDASWLDSNHITFIVK